MLTYVERKLRTPFGAQARIAEQFGLSVSGVSRVFKGVTRDREIEKALASVMQPRTTVTEAFGPPAKIYHHLRRERVRAGAAS